MDYSNTHFFFRITDLDLLVNIKRPVCLITDFAKASNKISSWVAMEIVTAPDEKSRVATIEAFIKVAQCCWELNSFNTAMDIISGLNSFSISRLKQIWDVRIATHATLETHETRGTHARTHAASLCIRQSVSARGHEVLDGLVSGMDPAGNFRNYRNHAETLAPPMTPYIGTEP